jgi:MoaA/NifB/PqqE/SkfB family radical SAM enzyme
MDLSKTNYPNALALSLSLISKEMRVSRNQRKLSLPIPKFMYFSVTHQCNLSCRGCYAKSWKKGDGLNIGQITSIIDQARELGTYIYVIAGGEPLMVDGLLEAISKRKGSIFLMFTNGTIIDEDLADSIVKVGNLMPVVSLDGPEEINDARRGLGVWKKTTDAMRLLQERGSLFGFSTMLTHQNYRALLSRNYLDLMWDLGCRLGFFIDYIPFLEDINPDYVLTTEDFQIKAELVKNARLESHPYVNNFPPDEYLANGGKCMVGKTSVHVNADGWLEPCPYSHYASHNLLETPLVDALQSNFFEAVREEFLGKENPSNTCHLFAMDERMVELAAVTGAESKDRAPSC